MTNFIATDHPRGLPDDTSRGATRGSFAAKQNTAPEADLADVIRAHTTKLDTPDSYGQYDSILEYDGTFSYRLGDELNRIGGPAIDYGDGRVEYWVHGRRLAEPEPHGMYRLIAVDGDHQSWASGTGTHTVEVTPTATIYYRDGDVHRDGGPAVIEADGTERWKRNGTEIPDPNPAPPIVEVKVAGAEEIMTTTGSRYVEGRPVRETAKAITAGIADLTKTGVLDRLLTYKVEVQKFQGDPTPMITVRVSGLNAAEIYAKDNDWPNPFFTPRAESIRGTMTKLGEAYNKLTTERSTYDGRRDFHFQVSFPKLNGSSTPPTR